MTKTIDTLVNDMKEVLQKGTDLDELLRETVGGLGDTAHSRLLRDDTERSVRLWFSNIGRPCARQLWYRMHEPDKAEPLSGPAKLKFLYGDLIEEIALGVAKLAGHSVTEEQTRLEWNGISGRIDAVIDGVLVDVKSASPASFNKFVGGIDSRNDPFGYLGQLKGYLLGAFKAGVPLDSYNKGAFLAINKVTGNITLDFHEFSDDEMEDFEHFVNLRKDQMDSEYAPERAFNDKPDGAAGNKVLELNCSYCDFKSTCWPSLRTFLYKSGPKHFTKVVKRPQEHIQEVPSVTQFD